MVIKLHVIDSDQLADFALPPDVDEMIHGLTDGRTGAGESTC